MKEDNLLMAYQICFDLYESASQQFLSSVIQNLRTVGTPIPAVPGSTNIGTVPTSDKDRWEENKDPLIPRLKHGGLFMFTKAYEIFTDDGSDLFSITTNSTVTGAPIIPFVPVEVK